MKILMLYIKSRVSYNYRCLAFTFNMFSIVRSDITIIRLLIA